MNRSVNIVNHLLAFWWTLRKEMTVWLRDPKVFGASIMAPLVLLFAFQAIASGRPVALAVTDLDQSTASRQFIQMLGAKDNPLGGKYFRVLPMTLEDGRRQFAQQDVLVWLTIPNGFATALAGQQTTTLELAMDNYNSDFAKNIRLYINEGMVSLYEGLTPQAKFDIVEVHESGTKISWVQSIGMGLVGLSVILASLFNGFNGLLTEYKTETIKNVLLAPRSIFFHLGAKAVYSLFGAAVSGLLMLGLLQLLTGLAVWSELGGFLLLIMLAGLIYIAAGMMIGLWMRRYMPAAATSMILGVTTWFLSGSLGELRLYTPTIQAIAAFLPITYMEEGLRGLLLYHDPVALWNNALYLLLFLAITLAALMLVARRKMALSQ